MFVFSQQVQAFVSIEKVMEVIASVEELAMPPPAGKDGSPEKRV